MRYRLNKDHDIIANVTKDDGKNFTYNRIVNKKLNRKGVVLAKNVFNSIYKKIEVVKQEH